MRTSTSHVLLSALLLTSVVAFANAQQNVPADVPRTISYQGLLTTHDGNPLPTGTYDIAVALYADEAGSFPIWQSTYSTSVINGIFNLYLGSGSLPLPDPAQMNRPLWIGTSVNGSGEMAPLTPLTSSPYALNLPDRAVTTSKLADGAVTAEKVEMDYISELQIDGQKISAKGTVLNLVSTPSVPLNYDEATRSVTIGEMPAQTSDDEKGAGTLAIQRDLWSANGDAHRVPMGGAFYAPTATDMLGPLTAGVPFNLTTATGFVMVYQPSTIAGAFDNIIGGNGNTISAASDASVIAGGGGVGAASNAILGGSDKSAIGGGATNTIGTANVAVDYSVVAGGESNAISSGDHGTIGGGEANIVTGAFASVGGGQLNVALGNSATIPGGDILLTNASYAQSAMGFFNAPRGAVGVRPATAALTNDPLFMVGNGDINAAIRRNAFEVSYNGHSVVSDVNGTGVVTPAVTGGTYEDNVIYGWAEVAANGALICSDFGIASIQHPAAGVYRITLAVRQPDGIGAAPISCGAAVATLGTGTNPSANLPEAPPANLSCAYIWTTNIVNNVFDVFITVRAAGNDCSTGTDRPFKFHVTGRPQ